MLKWAAKCTQAAVYTIYFGRVNSHTCPHTSCPVSIRMNDSHRILFPSSCTGQMSATNLQSPVQTGVLIKLKFLTSIADCIILVDGLKKEIKEKSHKMLNWFAKCTFAAVYISRLNPRFHQIRVQSGIGWWNFWVKRLCGKHWLNKR